ncbi:MAG: hypothetical protein Q8K13_18420 [Parvibaculum sp.]|uniref:hypothetical protein n=1 Tax=Parvibaculum sp. TaxID=2024848 RepID=UPI002730C51C|nr:hypothetical protein [Parvibaculum sp.]MDP2151612.1 hypothetical protein [Parvibaculum sp.]
MVTILGFIIGILGLVATLVGLYFTYISFVNPITRFKKYLKNPKDWQKFKGTEMHLSIYRHKKYPNFQIIIDWDRPVVENYQEKWIRDYPDKENNASYYVRLEANAMLLEKELFVLLDGGRAFIPSPRWSLENNEQVYRYDTIQIQLANIIGEYSWEKDIYKFASQQKKPILIEK